MIDVHLEVKIAPYVTADTSTARAILLVIQVWILDPSLFDLEPCCVWASYDPTSWSLGPESGSRSVVYVSHSFGRRHLLNE